jgi:putative transposase
MNNSWPSSSLDHSYLIPLAIKSVKQSYSPPRELLEAMKGFKEIVNECIRMGMRTNVTSLKRLPTLFYQELRKKFIITGLPSCFFLTAISKAAGILASRKKSIKRGVIVRDPYLKKIVARLILFFQDHEQRSTRVLHSFRQNYLNCLNKARQKIISERGIQVRSFTVSSNTLSISIRKEVAIQVQVTFSGVDINASNISYGNHDRAIQFNLKKTEMIYRATREIMRSFKRNDARIRKALYSKYGKRRSERVKQILHHVSKIIVENAKKNVSATVFEDITGLRNLYGKGNYQSKNFRARMNSVPWYEIKRQIEYKAAWEGVPAIQLTKGETRGTSKICPVCGERLHVDRSNRVHFRELWCGKCGKWRDRDVVAVMNISYRGWLRFVQSREKGEASEAMVQEREKTTAILKVDASKLSNCQVVAFTSTMTKQNSLSIGCER